MTFSFFKVRLFLITVLLPLLITLKTVAQSDNKENKWHYLGEVYMMFPTMSGEIGVGNLPPVTVDADAATILGQLELGAMFYFEADHDKWAFSSDLLYMKLGQDLESNTLVSSGSVDMSELAWELAALHRITPCIDAGLGARLVGLGTGLEYYRNSIPGGYSIPVNEKVTKYWVDPIIVGRFHKEIKDKWLIMLRADIGGFGVGSKLAWQIQAYAGYRFSELFQITVGYRIISIDYDKGSGKDHFLYDVNTYGPVIRFGFNF